MSKKSTKLDEVSFDMVFKFADDTVMRVSLTPKETLDLLFRGQIDWLKILKRGESEQRKG